MAEPRGAGRRLPLLEQLADAARSSPDEPAMIVDGGATMTFAELDERSACGAAALAGAGLGARARIVVIGDERAWDAFVVGCFAGYRLGATVVPASARMPDLALHELARSTGAAALLTTAPGAARRRSASPMRCLALDELLVGAPPVARQPDAEVEPGDLAYVVQTSGSSGAPKSVAVPYANVAALHPATGAPRRGRRSIFLVTAAIGTQAAQTLVHDCVGGPLVVVAPAFDARRHCELIERHRVTTLGLVPSSAAALLAAADQRDDDLSSVRLVVSSSAPLAPTLFDALTRTFANARVFNSYTLTEGVTLVNDHASGRTGSIGRPDDGTDVRIVGPDASTLAAGAVGEIWLRHAGVPGRRHLGTVAASATRILDDGWVATGDLGYVDEDGFVYFVDRRDDVIVCAGHNVSSSEVESVLQAHPAVEVAAVVGVPHAALGASIAASVRTRGPVSTGELHAHCAERLPQHRRPHRIIVGDELPMTATGKVDKSRLRSRLEEVESAPARASDVAGDVLALVVTAWSRALGGERVQPDDRFLELGGHSLLAAEVAVELSSRLEREIPPALVLSHASARALADALAERIAAGTLRPRRAIARRERR